MDRHDSRSSVEEPYYQSMYIHVFRRSCLLYSMSKVSPHLCDFNECKSTWGTLPRTVTCQVGAPQGLVIPFISTLNLRICR